MKAIVLEKNGNQLTVLAEDGSFRKIRYPGITQIGEEIEVTETTSGFNWKMIVGIVALFIMVLSGVLAWDAFQPKAAVAMISLDINPSLQIALDDKGRISDVEALNSDAEKILNGLVLKKKMWQEALEDIIGKTVALNYLNRENDWIVVGYSSGKSGVGMKVVEMPEIANFLETEATKRGIVPRVAVFELSDDEKAGARENGLTLGEYGLLLAAQKAGVQANPAALKKAEGRRNLLEKTAVREHLIKEGKIKSDPMPGTLEREGSVTDKPGKADTVNPARPDNAGAKGGKNQEQEQSKGPKATKEIAPHKDVLEDKKPADREGMEKK